VVVLVGGLVVLVTMMEACGTTAEIGIFRAVDSQGAHHAFLLLEAGPFRPAELAAIS
jgi:hypothetical protein